MIFAWILLAVAAVLLGGSYYAYRIAFFSPADGRENTPEIQGTIYESYRDRLAQMFRTLRNRPYEPVTIQSYDGLTLFARYYHTADGAPLDIGFHGYRSSYLADFCGGSDLCLSQGHNLLLIDQRAHGKSQGSTISFGINERKDALSWIHYAIDRFGNDTEICLYGVSMGAATVLMAAGMDLPGNVKGIIADCPYVKASDIIVAVGKTMKYPQWFTVPCAWLGARLFGGFDLYETDAVKAAANTKVPILIIHGEEDKLVPAKMSELARQANPEMVHRVTFPGAGHALSYMVDTERYRKVATEFMNEVLN